jgi:hypothetical protein
MGKILLDSSSISTILVAAAGALVWLYRGARKRRIQRRFQGATAAAGSQKPVRAGRRKP